MVWGLNIEAGAGLDLPDTKPASGDRGESSRYGWPASNNRVRENGENNGNLPGAASPRCRDALAPGDGPGLAQDAESGRASPEMPAMIALHKPGNGAAPAPGWPMERNQAALALSVLGDETRLDIFGLLSALSPHGLSPVAVSRELGIGLRITSKHLTALRRSRLVHMTRKGRCITYRADRGMARDCLTFIHELAGLLHPA